MKSVQKLSGGGVLFDNNELDDILNKPYGNVRFNYHIENKISKNNPYYSFDNWIKLYNDDPDDANNLEYIKKFNLIGGKKRRTKRSKAPTSKRTRAKKCTKKAVKKSTKKMRS